MATVTGSYYTRVNGVTIDDDHSAEAIMINKAVSLAHTINLEIAAQRDGMRSNGVLGMNKKNTTADMYRLSGALMIVTITDKATDVQLDYMRDAIANAKQFLNITGTI